MKNKKQIIVILTTYPDLKIAKKIIHALVQKKLIACGNIFKIDSIYTWQNKIEQTPEYGAYLKTTRANYKKVEQFIKNNHPYDVPEIIAFPITMGLPAYLEWVRSITE